MKKLLSYLLAFALILCMSPAATVLALVHEWGEWSTKTESTCISSGSRERHCLVTTCTDAELEDTDKNPDNHEGGTEVRDAQEATYTQAGYTGDLTCLGCGKILEEGHYLYPDHPAGDVDGTEGVTVADARLVLRASIRMNDIADEWYPWADADCDGAVTVADARLVLRTAIRLDKENILPVRVVSLTPSSCAGEGQAVIEDGSAERTLTIAPKSHTFVLVSTTDSTCTAKGHNDYICSVCSAEKSEVIPMKAHISAGDATCTLPETCLVCNAVLAPAKGHSFAAATCTKKAECTVCGQKTGETAPHSYKAATCTSPATCTVCGQKTGSTAPHNYEKATCTSPATCSDCGAVSGNPLGHNYLPATYQSASKCRRCGVTKGDPLGVTYSSKGYKITTTEAGLTYVDGILIVNKTYTVPSSYNPGGLTAECQAAFNRMKADAAKQGIGLWELSGFRSYATQSRLYNNYAASDGYAAADRYSARPGHSEHQTGLAIDVNSLKNSFKNTAEGRWLKAHCAEYGFIIRYPEGKESKTGYIFEPWHIRYIGDVAKAKAITASGLCLEEYYGLNSSYGVG